MGFSEFETHLFQSVEAYAVMPAGIGRLTCLKTLQLFVVGQQMGHRIEELGCLSQLRGKLQIRNLDMVRDKEEAMGARLSEKATVQELELVFGMVDNAGEDRCEHDEDVLEGLQPHSNLKGLAINYYCGERCPSWMLEREILMPERVNFLKNLVSISFFSCKRLQNIPSLLLSNEAKVSIFACRNLKSIADSSLQKLIIGSCNELVRVEVGPFAMKSLKELHVRECGKLENLPMISKLQSLEILELERCQDLRMIGDDDAVFGSTCLKELHICDCEKLMSMPSVDGLSSLHKINISNCAELKGIGDSLSTAMCLKELTLERCPGLTFLPSLHGLSFIQKIVISSSGKSIWESLCTATCLQELAIVGCPGLASFPSLYGLSSLKKIDMSWCGDLKNIGESLCTATCLKELTIEYCNALASLSSLHGLSSLQKIHISFCEELKRIGESLPNCLKELSIHWCHGLRSLPSGLPSCTALEELRISGCPNLMSIPDDLRSISNNRASLARLKKLEIGGFPTELQEFPDLSFIRSSLEELILIGWGEPRERLLDQIQHLTALRSLKIQYFDGLEALPDWLGNLSSLQYLELFSCESLKHMEAIRCLTKLHSLRICFCPELEERCARGRGSVWHNISHIPNIQIEIR